MVDRDELLRSDSILDIDYVSDYPGDYYSQLLTSKVKQFP